MDGASIIIGINPCDGLGGRGGFRILSSVLSLVFTFMELLGFDFKFSSIEDKNPGLEKISLISQSNSPRDFCCSFFPFLVILLIVWSVDVQ